MLFTALVGGCALLACTASAFNFIVDDSSVNECGNVRFDFTSGTPPYQIVAIGVFDMPVNVTVPDSAVNQNGGAFVWEQLPFNASSQVVFVMSDANGFATGGASKLYTVGSRPSGVGDCLRTDGKVQWTFAINPMDSEEEVRLPQCQAVSFSWQGAFVAPVTIIGVIPSGMVIGGAPTLGNGISYPLNVALGSEIVYVAWDSRGVTGGTSYVMRVTDGNNTCLDGSTASTTPVPPWNPSPTASTSGTSKTTTTHTGGGVVTMTAIQTVMPERSSASSALTPGAIAGIVVGGVGALIILQALIIWCCCKRQVGALIANRKKKKEARRKSGSVNLYEPGTGHDGLLAPDSMRDNRTHASYGYTDDDLGSTISPFMGGTTDSGSSPRLSMTSGTTGTNWAATQPCVDRSSGHGPLAYTTYPPTNGDNRSTSNGTGQSSTSRLPMKMQLALSNPDNRVFEDGQPSLNPPLAGFRRHEDAGPLPKRDLVANQPEDLPPTYNPQWGAGAGPKL
ncbi:hypothetical protein CcaverHIS002_0409580 [Cutaneotrichosporon cavernicola]|uniref:Mid2 domain-containing protein n=1 Tax=Cutaneotrichosporon cavernicola TaxID=279322 RepID=A0AA48QW85_9TREE|nr:uncharacterized protein CcaverHIS019_0409500 [Cutaneotrichosporon cavernicola]BEI84354.1 hypothetical protein CcaverHIS002_0409580 [Cutaneotrichosporon cavernicola]BEI92130.1 hypothetical protein CcaverHIS019_0409500 [Cutaneotrichosporon cavernicola]BEI99900.1 hypothetical protein CcaverHIS631_0409430 [Cutaneotrichosporon cavernicola]BEJ07675.1 hypothetical protein CcaverHIS641_0409440 [Cutaneotrichosporon cavernicola]